MSDLMKTHGEGNASATEWAAATAGSNRTCVLAPRVHRPEEDTRGGRLLEPSGGQTEGAAGGLQGTTLPSSGHLCMTALQGIPSRSEPWKSPACRPLKVTQDY